MVDLGSGEGVRNLAGIPRFAVMQGFPQLWQGDVMKENKQDQAGENKGSVNQDKASSDRKLGELSVEELAKVSGGRTAYTANTSNGLAYQVPTLNTFKKG